MKPEDDILKQFGLEDDQALRDALACMDNITVKPNISKESAWERFEQSVEENSRQLPDTRSFSFKLVWKIAASVAVLVVSAWFAFNAWNNVTYTTDNKQIKEITLPDNSTVTLNAASSLSFRKFGWKSTRKVLLTGEGLFKVTKGNSFEVISQGNTVKVLGTEFNIFSRNNYFEVKCISGKVQVQIPGSQKIILNKGKAVRKSETETPQEFNITANNSSWVNGDFYFNRIDLNLVLDEIERQFDVQIGGDTIMNRQYTGYFNKKDMNQALQNVCLPMGLNFKIINDTVIIKKGF
jgi:ferric-dicitrate binding protein FerR (iron transport regulator)